MRLRSRLALLLLIMLFPLVTHAQDDAPEPGAPGVGDSLYPTLGNGGYQVEHYTLDLTVDLETGNLEAVTRIEAIATDALSSFNLDFSGMTIETITVDDEAASFTRDDNELTVLPAEPLAVDQTFAVEVAYYGVPQGVFDASLGIEQGWTYVRGIVYTAGEPVSAQSFFPVNEHPSDKATYTIVVTVAQPYNVAANGILESETDNGDGTTTYRFEMRDPMASYLTTVNIAEFVIQTDESEGGIPIRNYFYARAADDATEAFSRQGEMLDFFSEMFGDYPFETYGVVVVPVQLFFALETQTLSIFGSGAAFGTANAFRSEEVIAHEMAHQWFGDSVALDDWSDIWLNEGFATYASWLWLEHDEGQRALDRLVSGTYNFIAGNGMLGNRSRESILQEQALFWPPPGSPPADELFNGSVYQRGALVLHALRYEIGDEAFFQTMQDYYAAHEGENVRTTDFIAAAEAASGQELDAFFQVWVYGKYIPDIPGADLFNRVTPDVTAADLLIYPAFPLG